MKRQRVRKGIIIISFLLLPVTLYYFSPMLIIESAFAGAAAGSMVVFALLFLFSLFFGRAFCGWACPLGGLQECLSSATGKRAKGGRRNWIKYFIWAPWLGFVAAGAVVAGGIRRMDFFYLTAGGISVSDLQSLIIYFIVVFLVTVLALTAGKRSMCHYICWIAPFMVLGTKIKDALGIPSLHLEADPSKCANCRKCSERCPMSLGVDEMVRSGDMHNDECILCGECADGCPKKAVCFRWKRRAAVSRTKSAAV